MGMVAREPSLLGLNGNHTNPKYRFGEKHGYVGLTGRGSQPRVESRQEATGHHGVTHRHEATW